MVILTLWGRIMFAEHPADARLGRGWPVCDGIRSRDFDVLSRRHLLVRAAMLGLSLMVADAFSPRLSLAAAGASSLGELGAVCVPTEHNDNNRSGANLRETILNTRNVNATQFGRLCTRPVVGDVYAQALYMPEVLIPGLGSYNVVYVATTANNIYGFDADNLDPDPNAGLLLSRLTLNPPFVVAPHVDAPGGTTFEGTIGIVGTPVINPLTNTMYLVTFTSTQQHWLHGLDISSLQTRLGPIQVQASVAGPGGQITFDSRVQVQRPGLLLENGIVYVGFGSQVDSGDYHGWILAYDAETLQQIAAFNATPGSAYGGIWQSGQGLASDSKGNVYAITGNSCSQFRSQTRPQCTSSTQPDQATDLGNSFVRLSPDLRISDWFTPFNFVSLNLGDLDLGSSGPLIIPGTQRLIGGGKEGKLYVLDISDPPGKMGHFNSSADQVRQSFQATGLSRPESTVPAACGFDPDGYHHIHSAPVCWSQAGSTLVYVWGENDWLRAFSFSGDTFTSTQPVAYSALGVTTCASTLQPDGSRRPGMPGGALSISADGAESGTAIVWATHPEAADATYRDVAGVFQAFDASNLSLLWDSRWDPAGTFGNFAKFCPPTIANGKAYVPSFSGYLAIYGLKDQRFRFYSVDTAERDYAVNNLGFVREGVTAYVFTSQVPGTVPLFRLNHPNGDHFYTIDAGERDNAIVNFGYRYEGVACYVYATQATGTSPLYRLNTQAGYHFYTFNSAERDKTRRALGYRFEGIACYVFAIPTAGAVRLFRLVHLPSTS